MLNQTTPNQTRFDNVWISQHIPHQGNMCLLDYVESWDTQHIQCSASSHRAKDNPLRAFERLGTACGIEYTAQAMAVHGALLASPDSTRAQVGYLVSVRSTQLYVPRLDNIAADLLVEATCIARNGNDILYQFRVSAHGRQLLDGRAAVILDANVLNVNALTHTSENSP